MLDVLAVEDAPLKSSFCRRRYIEEKSPGLDLGISWEVNELRFSRARKR